MGRYASTRFVAMTGGSYMRQVRDGGFQTDALASVAVVVFLRPYELCLALKFSVSWCIGSRVACSEIRETSHM